MTKKKKTERTWSYRRAQEGWEVWLDGKSKGIVVKDGSSDSDRPWRWQGKRRTESLLA